MTNTADTTKEINCSLVDGALEENDIKERASKKLCISLQVSSMTNTDKQPQR